MYERKTPFSELVKDFGKELDKKGSLERISCEEAFMRQFYLSKNSYGFYSVRFIDPKTGKLLPSKSTHSRDKFEAYNIASKWLENGVSAFNANSRAFQFEVEGKNLQNVKIKNDNRLSSQKQDLQSFVDSLSQSDINSLIVMLAQKVQGDVSVCEQPLQVPTQICKTRPANTKNVALSQCKKVSCEKKIPLVSALFEFWDFENSKYLREERAYGRNISQRHAKEMLGLAKRYWAPYFGDDRFVDEISKNELEEFFMYLRMERGLSGATVNHAMSCASKMYTYLIKKELISRNPFENLSRFGLDTLKRGIPTETEVAKLMKHSWKNPDAQLAFCIAAFAGLRAGEISGLRVCDLDLEADIIHVRHTWNELDGLKSTKNTDTRDIPIDHETMIDLMALAKRNTLFSDLSYVFWLQQAPDKPHCTAWYADHFYEALEEIGISEEQRKERVIVFHSLRHFCATLLRQRADLATVQTILGHRTEEMTEHYSSHMSESQAVMMKTVMSENKKHILQFAAA